MKKKIRYSLFVTTVFLLFLGIVEIGARVFPAEAAFRKWQFFVVFSLDRWQYLSSAWSHLRLETVMENPGFETYTEEPEKDRPPFDHVPYSFSVETNEFGFRDRSFDPEDKPTWALIGDSVSFGKGGTSEERYSNLMEQKLNIRIYNMALQGCTSECMAIIWRNYHQVLSVDGIILQGSGNDIDQSGWKQAIQASTFSYSQQALQWVSHSVLLQRILFSLDNQRMETHLAYHVDLAAKRYGSDIDQIFSLAAQRNLPIVFVHLPYAYGYFYAEHMHQACVRYKKCVEVRPTFAVEPDDQRHIRNNSSLQTPHTHFLQRTQQSHAFSIDELKHIFPLQEYFHDVVHLNPIGHEAVAQSLVLAWKEHQLQEKQP